METDGVGNDKDLYEGAKTEDDNCHAESQLLETVKIFETNFIIIIGVTYKQHLNFIAIVYIVL